MVEKLKGRCSGGTIRAMPPSEKRIFSAKGMCTQLMGMSGSPASNMLSSARSFKTEIWLFGFVTARCLLEEMVQEFAPEICF